MVMAPPTAIPTEHAPLGLMQPQRDSARPGILRRVFRRHRMNDSGVPPWHPDHPDHAGYGKYKCDTGCQRDATYEVIDLKAKSSLHFCDVHYEAHKASLPQHFDVRKL